MQRMYCISYEIDTDSHPYYGLFGELTHFDACYQCLDNTWLISTSENADEIWQRLRTYITRDDFMFIIEVTDDFNGWLPKEAWEWIDEHIASLYAYSMSNAS